MGTFGMLPLRAAGTSRRHRLVSRPAGCPVGHDAAVPDEIPDLQEVRTRIDDVDRRLIALLAERARLVGEVVHYKRAHHMPVVDRAREDRMLDRIAHIATEAGVDPRVAQQVLRTIIDGFTLLEVEELGPDEV